MVMGHQVSKKSLDSIIDEMTEVVVKSKDEIFYISEEAHNEFNSLKVELEETKEKVKQYITKSKKLEAKVRRYRQKLSKVNKEFDKYSEDEIRAVYEKTHNLQTEFAICMKEEKTLRLKRDDLERRMIRLKNTIEHAENLGQKISVILTYLDEDFQAVNEVIKTAHEKQQFGLKIIEAQEEERRKLSREIHDGPAQMLANLLIRSEIIDRSFRKGDTDEAFQEIKNIRETIRRSLYEVRRIIYDLRPMALDDLGLIPTLQKYVSTVSDYSKNKIELMFIGEDERLEAEYEVAFFRMIQEAIQNAVKHAEANFIKVKLEVAVDRVNIIVEDDGIGFDSNDIGDNSFGIIGMKERVEMLEGTIAIKSTLGIGTTIVIQVPVDK